MDMIAVLLSLRAGLPWMFTGWIPDASIYPGQLEQIRREFPDARVVLVDPEAVCTEPLLLPDHKGHVR